MKKYYQFTSVKTICILLFSQLIWNNSFAQSITNSFYQGGDKSDFVSQGHTIIKDGFIYQLVRTNSTNITTTDGSTNTNPNSFDLWFLKMDTIGNVIHSRLIGGDADDVVYQVKMNNNSIYLAGYTQSTTFPTTDGSTPSGGNDAYVMKLDTSGTVLYSRLFGGSGNEAAIGMDVENDEVYFYGATNSVGFSTTDGSTLSGLQDFFVIKLNSAGNTVYSTLIGGSGTETERSFGYRMKQLIVENGEVYFSGQSLSSDFPITTGPAYSGQSSVVAIKLKANGTLDYASYIGGANHEQSPLGIALHNKEMYIVIKTLASDFPVTNGIAHPGPNGDRNHAIVKISKTGNLMHSRFLSPTGSPRINEFELYDGALYFSVKTNSLHFTPTNGSTPAGDKDIIFVKLDTALNTTFSSFYGGSGGDFLDQIVGDSSGIFLHGSTSSANFPVTNGSVKVAGNKREPFVIKLNTAGNIEFSSYYGGKSAFPFGTQPSNMIVKGNKIYVNGYTMDQFVVTDPASVFKGNFDIYITSFDMCLSGYVKNDDTLSPGKQLVCINGFVDEIKGKKIVIPSDSLATLYYGGIPSSQAEISANYQWQTSTAATGPWSDIAGAVSKNFSPQPTTFTVYYRRLARKGPQCNNEIISISNVDTIEVSAFTAPIIDAGGIYNTCSPSAGITLGATPLPATGGLTPYTYSWDFIPAPDSAFSNPVVAPSANTVYTLTVIDANGCRQLDQALVNVYSANAGPDVSSCAGDSVRLQGMPLPGISGVTYSWLPTTGLSQPSIIQPNVLPGVTTDYELTMTFPKTGGGTCTELDTATVFVVAAPVTANFAGPDRTMCLGNTASLGTPAEAGFTYTWAPGKYLTSNSTSLTTYQTGNISFPNPDSGIYYLTAAKEGCFYADAVSVFVINADAGMDGCGPKILGNPSRSDVSSLNETFQWEKLSGDANMLADSNTVTVPVSGATVASTFRLTTTLNGHTCTDEVVVSPCGCSVNIGVTAEAGCPNFNLSPVTLTANGMVGGSSNYTYSWTPLVGLSSYGTSSVMLTDNVPRNYTVTITSNIDPTFTCSASILVNQPAMTIPVFSANDTVVCSGETVNIGNINVVGYSYLWSPSTGLMPSEIVSNPSVTPTESQDYAVKVTDVGTGCYALDTATVTIREPIADAGDDWTICSAATVTLGTPSKPDHVYAWTPGSANYQNLTDSTFALPEILVTIDLDFFLAVTDTITGCMAFDTVSVDVNGSPTVVNSPDIDLCLGAKDTIGSPALPGVTYVWTSPSGTGDLSSTTVAQPIVTASTTAAYTMTATFTGGCSVMDLVTVTMHDPSFTLTDLNYCPSGAAVALGAGAPGGMSTYSWTPAALVTDPAIANPSTLSPPPPSETTYVLTVTDAFGCTATDDIKLTPTVDPPNAGNNQTICLNETTQIGDAANPTGGTITYSWSPATGLDNSTSPNPTFTPTSIGTFKFALNKTDASLPCTSSDTVIITVNDYQLSTMPSTTICQNASINIGVTNIPGAQYFWSPTASLSDSTISMPVATPSATTTYTLISVGLNGCVATGNVTIGVNASPAPIITMSDTTVCLGTASANFNPSVTPVATNHNYLWSPNDGTVNDIYALNPNITPGGLGSKSYTLTVTDTAGCTSFASADLIVQLCPPTATQGLGNYVWLDLDKDGIQDAGEVGVAGVTVDLYDNGLDGLPNTLDDVLTGSTVTDAYGLYYFNDIPTGSYNLGFTPLSNYTFTNPVGSGDNSDNTNSDVNISTAHFGRTGTFVITSAEQDATIDAGLVLPTSTTATVGDYVWFDTNTDGIQDNTESGVSGVVVTLLDASGNIVASTVTDANGKYLFQNVDPATYSIEFKAPLGSVFTTTGGDGVAGGPSDSETDSDVLTNGKTPSFTVAAGDNYRNIDAGIVTQSNMKVSLGDRVWYDDNQDGVQDAGEVGIQGVTVVLRDSIGNTIGTTTTDVNGNYTFNNLDPGKYTVKFTAPAGYTASPADTTVTIYGEGADKLDSDADPTTGETGIITLITGRRNSTIDAGFYKAGILNSIGDKVWYDNDKDGVQDSGEEGAMGITVSLLDGSGNAFNNPATGTPYVIMTDKDGFYKFVGLPDGNYQIQFDNLPGGYTYSPSNTPGDNSDNTNSDANLNGRTSTFNLTGGEDDMTVDAGIFSGEIGLTASLGNKVWYDLDNDGIQDPSEAGVSGVIVTLRDYGPDGVVGGGDDGPDRITSTNSQGEYLFTNLGGSNYVVEFTNLPAGYATSPQNSGSDDDVDSDGGTISGSKSSTAVITLADGEENLSVDLGIYKAGVNSIGNYVWIDTNQDGQQGSTILEPAISGVQVTLLDALGNVYDNDLVTAGVQPYVTTTDVNGFYLFTDLPDGTYSTKFSNLPEGYEFTGMNVGAGATDSDVDPLTGKTNSVTVTGGQTDLSLDAGIFSTTKAALGDFVWSDDDGDGVQDSGEQGIPGVLVTLYDNLNNPIATTITDANGRYLFPNLNPDTYSVGFTNLPEGTIFTGLDLGGDDAADSDVDPNTGRTASVTLAGGDVNLTLDAGVKPPSNATVGNYVWFDMNSDGIQDADEPGVPGVIATLKDGNGNVIGTTMTDGEGQYLFTNVPPGINYTVTFDANLPNLGNLIGTPFYTIQDPNNTGGNKSIVPNTGAYNGLTSTTPVFDVTLGSHTRLLDAGITKAFPLPMDIIDLGIDWVGNYSKVYWKTASEINTSHFEIERSLDGIKFVKVGEEQSKSMNGNSSSVLAYEFMEDLSSNLNSIFYYRIVQVDLNGLIDYSKTLVLTRNEVKVGYKVSVFPNPATSELKIQIEGSTSKFTYNFTNALGQKILEGNIGNLEKIDISDLSLGTYFFNVFRNGEAIDRILIVKE